MGKRIDINLYYQYCKYKHFKIYYFIMQHQADYQFHCLILITFFVLIAVWKKLLVSSAWGQQFKDVVARVREVFIYIYISIFIFDFTRWDTVQPLIFFCRPNESSLKYVQTQKASLCFSIREDEMHSNFKCFNNNNTDK